MIQDSNVKQEGSELDIKESVLSQCGRDLSFRHTYWLVGGADSGKTTSSSSYSGPSCMSPSSTVPPGPPQPGGGGGGGGSGGNTVGPSGPVDVGEIRLAGPSDTGE